MADTTTMDALHAEQLRGAALEVAVRELGGQLTDWQVTHEGPGQVVVKGWRGQRFGSFAASFDATAGSVQTESYGTRGSETPSAALTPLPTTGAQAEAVARALDQWLASADRDDNGQLAEREHVRAFRRSLAQQSEASQQARRNAETLFRLLRDPHADDHQLRDLAGELAAFVHPRAGRRFSRE